MLPKGGDGLVTVLAGLALGKSLSDVTCIVSLNLPHPRSVVPSMFAEKDDKYIEILPKESNHVCLSKGYLLNILQGLIQILLFSVLKFLVIEVGAQRASPGIKSLALFAWSQPQFSPQYHQE